MDDRPSDLVQGTLEMLVLKTLALEPIHGYGIALRIDQMSGGVFHVNPGSLFPALSRMERARQNQGGVAGNREQSPGQVLPAYGRREKSAQRRNSSMGKTVGCDQQNHGSLRKTHGDIEKLDQRHASSPAQGAAKP